MASIDERGIEGHLSIEKSRVWDLKSTGQVTTSGRSAAGIACICCFHPTDPTLCVVTVQGSGSVLSFYNAHSGGKMSTLPLQGVVSAAQFSKDGSQIVVIFRVDPSLDPLLRQRVVDFWSRSLIPFKKDTRPAEHLLLALSPSETPVIYFASSGQQRVHVAFSALPASKTSLLSSAQKASFSTKLTSAGIMGLAGHPDEYDILFAMLSDGGIQAFSLEQMNLKKLFTVGDLGVYSNCGHLGQFEVVAHPFIAGAALILAAAAQELIIYVSFGRGHIAPVDRLSLRGMKRVHGEARVFLVFGEMADGKLTCIGARFSGTEATGMSLVPVNISFSDSAMDVAVASHSVSGIANISDRGSGSWMELWDAVPAWAQSASHFGSSRPRIRNVKIHSTMDAIAAQSAASGPGTGPHVLLWSINDASHPVGGSNTGLVVPQHTALSLWTGPATATEYKLEFPHHCYYMSGNKLCSYGHRSKATGEIMRFNPPSGRSGPATAETVTFSKWHRAWLIFFRSFSVHHTPYGIEEWTWTLQREDEVGAAPAWYRPGISGVFIGPEEDHCCILDLDLFTVHVYPTKSVCGKDPPLLSLTLPPPGMLTPALFQGPPITQIPTPPPPAEFTSSGNLMEVPEENPAEVKLGYGVIIWVNKFRQIAMGTMISESQGQRSWHETDSVEFVPGGTFNELSEGEFIIQVSWQVLSEEDDAHQAPNSFTAAVLTNQRLMLFLANGYPVLSFPQQNSPGVSSPPLSCLWVGPALLYVTRTGEVHQLLWDGSNVMICGAPSTTGSAVLAAALADRILFLCRETESQSWHVATRHAIIGYALLMGWASLASSGLMPPAWVRAHARNQMKLLLQHFDASTVSVPVARALVQSGFADVAHGLVSRWPKGAHDIKVACGVAAKKWTEAAEGLMEDYKNSVYHPKPIPKGSTMWQRFYTVAMGAVQDGDNATGADLFAAAGEWERAFLFLALSGQTAKFHTVLAAAQNHMDSKQHTQLQSLADQLRKRVGLPGQSGASGGLADFEDLSSWLFAAPGYLPPMFCVQGDTPNGMIKDGDIGLIDPLETTDIKGYVSGASKKPAASNFLRRTITNTISGRSLTQQAGADSSSTLMEALEVGRSSSLGFQMSPKSATPKESSGKGGLHDYSDFGIDTKFSSDDEDDESLPSPQLERGRGSGKKFRIQIKKKEESHSGTSAAALREAAKNLRLGGISIGPSLGPSGFAAAMKGGGGMHRSESVSSVSSSQSHVDARLSPPQQKESYPDPFMPRHVATSSPPVDPFAGSDPFTSSSAKASFTAGVEEMEKGNWAQAIEAFSKPGVLTVPKGKQYLAAVLLLQERAAYSGSDAARLDRTTAALDLEQKHKKLMTLQAVRENMSLGNYAYAKGRLEWLVGNSSEQVSPTVLSSMQQQLKECDSKGAADSDVSPFENLDSIATRVENAASLEELKLTVNGLTF